MSEDRRPALSATTDAPQPAAVPEATPVVETPAAAPVAALVAAPVPAPTPEPEPGPIAARFGQLAAQRREAEARADRLERTAGEYKTQLETALAALTKIQSPVVPPAPVASDGPARPNKDAFPDTESFETALVSWASEQAAAKASAEFRRAQEEAESARREQARIAEETRAREAQEAEEARIANEFQSSWEARRAKAIEIHPDFSEVVEEPQSLPITYPMGYVIKAHEEGPEVGYFLGKNPKEAARIAAISIPGQVFPTGHPMAGLPMPNAIAQAFELGKIAAKLGSSAPAEPAPVEPTPPEPAPAPSGPTVVNPPPVVLPAPPTPISGASATAARRDLVAIGNEGSMEEYAAARRPQLLAERRPGRIH